ncbi:hypothetical protein HGRIS_002698 [Hohenbuehelia grisea]|uniref:Uncharacterized protein n=1 Tax=Hohenbuehelia grisea TaxID=104357 RepID=A0ABR3JND8_9AGAR
MARSLAQLLRDVLRLLTSSQHPFFRRLRLFPTLAWRFITLLWPRRFRKTRTISTSDDEKFTHSCSPPSIPFSQGSVHDVVCESRAPQPERLVAHSSSPYLHAPSLHSLSSKSDISITVEQFEVDDQPNASRASIRRPTSRSSSRGSPNRSRLSIPHSRPGSRASMSSVSSRRSIRSIIQNHGINPIASFGVGECASIGPSQLGDDIECIVTLDLVRYLRKVTIGPPMPIFTILPLESMLESTIGLPGWTRHIHPDGAPFYHHEQKRILTDSNMMDHETFAKVESFVDRFEDWIRAHNFDIPEDSELVLQVMKDPKRISDYDDGFHCGYYYAHHSSRSLFWLEENSTSNIFDHRFKENIISRSHAQIWLSVSYWQHWEYFSCTQSVTPELLGELTDILVTMLVDVTGSLYSNSPFSVAELQTFLAAIKEARKMLNTPLKGSPWFVGRLFSQIQYQRFIDFYGQHGARLTRDDSVHDKGVSRTWLIEILSPFLFSAPDVHLMNLRKVYTDDSVSFIQFKQFIIKLHNEWQDFVINGSVLLAANVAFLAIQSVDNDKGDDHRSPAQIASYLSTVSSISSIVMGLLLMRQTRNKEKESAFEAGIYLARAKTDLFGQEPLAIMYSLPFAFLMYAMVFFMVAFSLLCFLEANRITKVIFGAFWAFCLSMIAWTIYLNWEKPEALDIWMNGVRPKQILDDCLHWLREYVRKLPGRFKFRPSEDPESAR